MNTLYLCHPASLEHQTPLGRPERPDRVRVIERVLEHEKFSELVREQAPRADLDIVALAHPPAYAQAVADASPREGLVRIDADTAMSSGTLEAALRRVGVAVQAVDEVMVGTVRNAFCAMRPP